jgi:hypothetical protein
MMKKRMSAPIAEARKPEKRVYENERVSLRAYVENLNTPNQPRTSEHYSPRGKNTSSKRKHPTPEGQKEEGHYRSL